MAVILGVWLALAGAVALLAGLAGSQRRSRLRHSGQTAWAMVLPAQSGPAAADPAFSSVAVQFALDDGRVIERVQARPARKSGSWRPGQQVLVWYDPTDPSDVLVSGSEGRWSDRAFLAAGVVLVLTGIAIASLVR